MPNLINWIESRERVGTESKIIFTKVDIQNNSSLKKITYIFNSDSAETSEAGLAITLELEFPFYFTQGKSRSLERGRVNYIISGLKLAFERQLDFIVSSDKRNQIAKKKWVLSEEEWTSSEQTDKCVVKFKSSTRRSHAILLQTATTINEEGKTERKLLDLDTVDQICKACKIPPLYYGIEQLKEKLTPELLEIVEQLPKYKEQYEEILRRSKPKTNEFSTSDSTILNPVISSSGVSKKSENLAVAKKLLDEALRAEEILDWALGASKQALLFPGGKNHLSMLNDYLSGNIAKKIDIKGCSHIAEKNSTREEVKEKNTEEGGIAEALNQAHAGTSASSSVIFRSQRDQKQIKKAAAEGRKKDKVVFAMANEF